MRGARGKRVAMWAGVVALVVLFATGIAVKDRIQEEYWVWLLKRGDDLDKQRAALALIDLGSVRCIPFALERMQAAIYMGSGASEGDRDSWFPEIWRLGGRAVPPLLEAWEAGDRDRKRVACWAVLRLGADAGAAVPYFADLLRGSDDETVLGALQVMEGLVRVGDFRQEAAHAILAVTDHWQSTIRFRALAALAPFKEELGPEGKGIAVGLAAFLADPDEERRESALDALVKLGGEAAEALPALQRLLENGPAHAVALAIQVIGAVGPAATEAAPALVLALKSEHQVQAIECLVRFGRAALPALEEGLRRADEDVRIGCAAVLGRLGSAGRDAIPALIPLLECERPELRGAAAHALENIGADAVPFLVRLLDREDRELRLRAIQMLGRIGPSAEGARPALERFLQDDDVDFILGAKWALDRILAGRRPKQPERATEPDRGATPER